MQFPGPTPWLAWHRERPSFLQHLGAKEALRKQNMGSGTMIAPLSRARPALAGEYEGSGLSTREAIVEETLKERPQDFANKGLKQLCLGTMCA